MEPLPPNRRGMRLFLMACLGLLLVGCDGYSELVLVPSEKEANRILVALERYGIPEADKRAEERDRQTVWAITVPPEHVSAARQVLVRLDLPRENRGGLDTMIDSMGLIPTRADERARLMHAMAGELERTFETYDRVTSARVHVVIPDREMMLSSRGEVPPRPTATVVVKYLPLDPERVPTDPEADAPLTREEAIQIVSRSVEGLSQEDVYVAFTATTARPVAPTAPSGLEEANDSAATAQAGLGPMDANLMYQLFAALVIFGLIIITLIVLLVRKGRRQRAALPPGEVSEEKAVSRAA